MCEIYNTLGIIIYSRAFAVLTFQSKTKKRMKKIMLVVTTYNQNVKTVKL